MIIKLHNDAAICKYYYFQQTKEKVKDAFVRGKM
jgi:hypothetical protein